VKGDHEGCVIYPEGGNFGGCMPPGKIVIVSGVLFFNPLHVGGYCGVVAD